MPNTIRNPKPGTPKHIAAAVDNQSWQEFRVSLKGTTTQTKLNKLHDYYKNGPDDPETRETRIVNYLKALARGGQIAPVSDYWKAFQSGGLKIQK